MHKAYSALILLAKARNNLFQAAVWAQMQATIYRTLNEDPETASTYSRQALELQQQSGIRATIYTQHFDVAPDLLSLGKKEEAISEFLLARDTIPDKSAPVTAQIERKLIQAYLRKSDRTAANAELERFLRERGAQGFRSEALLSKADVEMDTGQIRDALRTVKAAWPLGKSQQTFQWETTNLLLECVLNASNTTSYDEALETARNIQAWFRDLPIPVIALAEDAIHSRRRLAGDLDSLLREDLNRLNEATQKKTLH